MDTQVQNQPLPSDLIPSDELHFLRYCYSNMVGHIDNANGGGTDDFLMINLDSLHADYVNETGRRVPHDYV